MIETEAILDSLTPDEMIGQMLCFLLSGSYTEADVEKIVQETYAGSFFVSDPKPDMIETCIRVIERNTKLPAMIAADIECGPGHVFNAAKQPTLPDIMAWGACDDPELVEKAHEATAAYCRKLGIHWSFAPIVDINYNANSPVVNIRAISDDPKQVIKIGTAALRGLQKDGLIAAGCKHFPGDGMDDRNQHFCTTVNSLSKEEWMATYGAVYKAMIEAGAASIMVAHIALPAYDEKISDRLGYLPATLSYNLQTKLLKGELGFKGCIVSDALSMIGASTVVPHDRLAVEYVKAGGDMLLFPLPEYFTQIKNAVLSGEIPMERIRDAAGRVIDLKKRARLFDDPEEIEVCIKGENDVTKYADAIAEKSLTVVRDCDNILPLDVKPGDEILLINLQQSKNYKPPHYTVTLDTLRKELKARGFKVKEYVNPSRDDIGEDMQTAAAVLINCKISNRDYHGGSLRVNWEHIAPFWRGEILKHPKVVFTSFGDPYKLYEFPYLPTYINAYSGSISSQKAFVKAVLGEIEFCGKSPVRLEGFFERGV